jgi:hypothetical protein
VGKGLKRSFKLKLIVPRDNSEASLKKRKGLGYTHCRINDVVRQYEQQALEMRQDDVILRGETDGEEFFRPGEEWAGDLRRRLEEKGIFVDGESKTLDDVKCLYRRFVKSYDKAKSGKAQDSRGVHSLLCDKSSRADQCRVEILKKLKWLVEEDEPPVDWKERLAAQIDEDPSLTKPPHRPPTWINEYNEYKKEGKKEDKEKWMKSLLDYVRSKKKEEGDPNDPVSRLRETGVLPIWDPIIKTKGASALTGYERMAFSHSVGHLLSWESGRHNAVSGKKKIKKKLKDLQRQAKSMKTEIAHLKDFEKNREEHLKKVALWSEESSYHLTKGDTRGWKKLREWLKENEDSSEEKRKERLVEMQSEDPRKYGSPEVMEWLAEKDQQFLASCNNGDPVSLLVAINELERKYEKRRELPLFTFTDAISSPRFVGFEKPESSSISRFDIREVGNKKQAVLPLLVKSDDGNEVVEKMYFEIAPSKQMRELKVTKEGKKTYLTFVSQDTLDLVKAELCGSNLLFSRDKLKSKDDLLNGQLGDVYLKISISYPDDKKLYQSRFDAAGYLMKASGNRDKEQRPPSVTKGLRIMGVDAGIRSQAISVIELVDQVQETQFGKVDEFSIMHQRSALLTLPGERPDKKEIERRREARDTWYRAFSLVGLLANVRRLADETDSKKRKKINKELIERFKSMEGLDRDFVERFESMEGLGLEKLNPYDEGHQEWVERIVPIYEIFENFVGKVVSEVLNELKGPSGKERSFARLGGKSMWQLEQLEKMRKLVLKWDRHSKPGVPIRRFDRSKQGTVAKKLLNEINSLKEDRVKTTADGDVQAARGRVYIDGRWVQRHEPADIMVLEDLSRYLFKTDRPAHENSQLMRWTHRAIEKVIKQQARDAGIVVVTTSAAFSSRFDSVTGAPGVRCMVVSKRHIEILKKETEGEWLRKKLIKKGLKEDEIEKLVPGALVPMDGGEIFVTLDKYGHICQRHADINAAQNVVLWFVRGHDRQFRLVAWSFKVDDGSLFVNRDVGQRLKSLLGGLAVVLHPLDDSSTRFTTVSYEDDEALEQALGVKVKGMYKEEERTCGEDEEDDDIEELLDDTKPSNDDRKVFFRDVSGVFFSKNEWITHDRFWGYTSQRILKALRDSNWCVQKKQTF